MLKHMNDAPEKILHLNGKSFAWGFERWLTDATGWFTSTTIRWHCCSSNCTTVHIMLTLINVPRTYREEHWVDIQGKFDEVVEVVGFPQFRVGRHGCWQASWRWLSLVSFRQYKIMIIIHQTLLVKFKKSILKELTVFYIYSSPHFSCSIVGIHGNTTTSARPGSRPRFVLTTFLKGQWTRPPYWIRLSCYG